MVNNIHYLDDSGAQESIDFYGYDPVAKYAENMCELVGVREFYEYDNIITTTIIKMSKRIDELEKIICQR